MSRHHSLRSTFTTYAGDWLCGPSAGRAEYTRVKLPSPSGRTSCQGPSRPTVWGAIATVETTGAVESTVAMRAGCMRAQSLVLRGPCTLEKSATRRAGTPRGGELGLRMKSGILVGKMNSRSGARYRLPSRVNLGRSRQLWRFAAWACYHAPTYRACKLRAMLMSFVPPMIVRPSGKMVSTYSSTCSRSKKALC